MINNSTCTKCFTNWWQAFREVNRTALKKLSLQTCFVYNEWFANSEKPTN